MEEEFLKIHVNHRNITLINLPIINAHTRARPIRHMQKRIIHLTETRQLRVEFRPLPRLRIVLERGKELNQCVFCFGSRLMLL